MSEMFGDAMMDARDEPDEDDWPQTSKLHAFSELEKILSCGICKGFLTNPKELPCGHLYCAECISRSMDNMLWSGAKNECPTCRAKTMQGQCKANVNIGKVVTIFKGLRKDLLELIEKDGKGFSNDVGMLLVDSPVKPKSKRTRVRARKVAEDTASDEEFASSAETKKKKGKVIDKSLTFFSFGNKPQVKKIKEQLTKVSAGSRLSLRLDGDEKKLLSRYRNFVHLHNAQVGGGDLALSLDEVVRKCNEDESIAERELKATSSADVAMRLHGDEGFKNLIMAEREKRRKLEEPKCGDKQSRITTSGSPVTPPPSASPKEGKENDDHQLGASTQVGEPAPGTKEDSGPLPKEYKMGKWHVVWSKKFNAPFFFDTTRDLGQMDFPDEVRSYFDDVSSESDMRAAVKLVNQSMIAEKNDKVDAKEARVSEKVVTGTTGTNSETPLDLTSDAHEVEIQCEDPTHWDCSMCTFRNDMNKAVCEMCQTKCPLPSKRTRAQKAGQSGSMQSILGSSKKLKC